MTFLTARDSMLPCLATTYPVLAVRTSRVHSSPLSPTNVHTRFNGSSAWISAGSFS